MEGAPPSTMTGKTTPRAPPAAWQCQQELFSWGSHPCINNKYICNKYAKL